MSTETSPERVETLPQSTAGTSEAAEARTYRHMVEVAMANGFDSLTDAITQAVAARRPPTEAEVAIRKAADQFAFYADEHAKKGTPEGDAKAATNMRWARFCASYGREPVTGEAADVGAGGDLPGGGGLRRDGLDHLTTEAGKEIEGIASRDCCVRKVELRRLLRSYAALSTPAPTPALTGAGEWTDITAEEVAVMVGNFIPGLSAEDDVRLACNAIAAARAAEAAGGTGGA